MASKKLLLSGVGGSIGCHFLAHIFHNTDWDIVGIDSFRHKGWTDRVKSMLDSHPDWAPRLTVVTHDMTAPFSSITKKKIGNVDYIISMASLSDVEASIQDPVPFIKNNVDLTLNLLEFAREVKPEVFIQISTDEVYGAVETKYDDLRKEWDAIVPSNPYAASKACQEAIAISYWRTYGVPVIITNTMNNVSEMQSASKYPVMVQRAVEEGRVLTVHGSETGEIGSRSYIHSRNFADAVLFIINNLPPYMHHAEKADKPDRYNIAGDIQLDNLELAQTIARLMGKELKYEIVNFHNNRPGHDPHYGLNMEKLKKAGWKQPLTFEESLKNVIEWQRANPEWISIEGHESYDKKHKEK